jgi:hypothetical protein
LSEFEDSLNLNKWSHYKVVKANERKIDEILLTPAIVLYFIGEEDLQDGAIYYRKYKILIGTKKKWIRFNVDLRNEIMIGKIIVL